MNWKNVEGRRCGLIKKHMPAFSWRGLLKPRETSRQPVHRRYSTPQSLQFKSRMLPLHQSTWCSGVDSPILPRVRVERWDIEVTWSYLLPFSNFTNCKDSQQSFNGNQTSVTSRYLCLCVCVCVCVLSFTKVSSDFHSRRLQVTEMRAYGTAVV